MKKVQFFSVALLAILCCWYFISCKENNEETPVHAPQIISMNFAINEEAYLQNNYLSNTANAGELYIGFELSDEDKDIKQIEIEVMDSEGYILYYLTGLHSIPIMDNATTSYGFDITLLANETLTFRAYARDSQYNISNTIEKTITIVEKTEEPDIEEDFDHTPEIISMNFAENAANYIRKKYINYGTYQNTSFYIGFELNDKNKDITNIHVSINSSEEKILSINNMETLIYSTGFTYILSEAGTFTISAYAEDAAGNYSNTVEKEFTISPHTPKIKSTHFALNEENYLSGNYITKLLQSAKNTPLYLGLEVEDFGKDITKIHIVIKDRNENELPNGSRVVNVDSMSSETWTGGINFSLSEFELLNWYYFYIYVEDKDGNKSTGMNSLQIDTSTIWTERITLGYGKSIKKSFTLEKAATLTAKANRFGTIGGLTDDPTHGIIGIYIYDKEGNYLLSAESEWKVNKTITCPAGTYYFEIRDGYDPHYHTYSHIIDVSLTK
ncbi:MAG: hypothetical protein HDR54_01215 [Treponema sp.]|nr:hypothetical protein [Treponema sp.]